MKVSNTQKVCCFYWIFLYGVILLGILCVNRNASLPMDFVACVNILKISKLSWLHSQPHNLLKLQIKNFQVWIDGFKKLETGNFIIKRFDYISWFINFHIERVGAGKLIAYDKFESHFGRILSNLELTFIHWVASMEINDRILLISKIRLKLISLTLDEVIVLIIGAEIYFEVRKI